MIDNDTLFFLEMQVVNRKIMLSLPSSPFYIELDEKKPLEMVYVTRDCTCEKLVQDILSLSEHGREAVVEYIELQRLKERQKK